LSAESRLPDRLRAEAPAVVEEPRRKRLRPRRGAAKWSAAKHAQLRRPGCRRSRAHQCRAARLTLWIQYRPCPGGLRKTCAWGFRPRKQHRWAEFPAQPVAIPAAPAVVEEPRPEVRRREVVRSEARPARPESVPAPGARTHPRFARSGTDPASAGPGRPALGASSPGTAPAGRIRPPFWQGNPERRKASRRGHSFCQAHPGPAAQAQAERFLRAAPQSPLAGRVRSACQKPDESTKQVNEIAPSREP